MYSVMQDISGIFGVSGRESSVSDYIINAVKGKIDFEKDDIGNLVCTKKGKKSAKKIAFLANMDEPGLIVTAISKSGLIEFATIGNVIPEALIGRKIRFENDTLGVVVIKPYVDGSIKYKTNDLAIDLGIKDINQIQKVIEFGMFAVIDEKLQMLNNFVMSRNLKSRLICAIMIDIINTIQDNQNDICFMFSVQDELGGRGAKVLSNYIDADIVIGLGVIGNDAKSYKQGNATQLGDGPIITLKEGNLLYDTELIKKAETALHQNGIKYSVNVRDDNESSMGMFLNNSQINGLMSFSLPIKYQGQGIEIMSLDDAILLRDSIKIMIEQL